MDIEPVLRASFPIPALEPDWQNELLLQLGSIDMSRSREGCRESSGPAPGRTASEHRRGDHHLLGR